MISPNTNMAIARPLQVTPCWEAPGPQLPGDLLQSLQALVGRSRSG